MRKFNWQDNFFAFESFGTRSDVQSLKNCCLPYVLLQVVLSDLKWVTVRVHKRQATITRFDLSSQFFCNDATLLCEFESDKIWINEFE